MKFSRQEYWSRLPFPTPGDLPNPGIEPASLCVSCIGSWFLYHCATWEVKFFFTDTAYSVQFSRSVISDSLRPQEPQHARPPSPSPTPGVHPNPCPLSQWCHPTISSSVVPFSSCPQSFSASGSFQMSQLFSSGGQSIGASASTSDLPVNTQDWSPLGWIQHIKHILYAQEAKRETVPRTCTGSDLKAVNNLGPHDNIGHSPFLVPWA